MINDNLNKTKYLMPIFFMKVKNKFYDHKENFKITKKQSFIQIVSYLMVINLGKFLN